MYQIGQTIIYPLHGAGRIAAMEEREILGQRRAYYVLDMAVGHMTIWVPVDQVEQTGLRAPCDSTTGQLILEQLRGHVPCEEGSWNLRYRQNLDLMRSGAPEDVCTVVCSLRARENKRGLSAGERKMYANARQILKSELELCKGLDEEAVTAALGAES